MDTAPVVAFEFEDMDSRYFCDVVTPSVEIGGLWWSITVRGNAYLFREYRPTDVVNADSTAALKNEIVAFMRSKLAL